jgi:diaminohydroxyphosphoribosylaminopyrimidine deaminase/5-amino-6-(5-phosphoribosylamino)uracil reductase
LWTGKNPVRMVIDMSLRLPATLKLFDQQQKTIVFNTSKQETNNNILYHQVKKEETILPQILNAAHKLQLQSILVEGGAKLLQSFIDAGLWDEARVIKNEQLTINNGLNAPILNDSYDRKEKIITDTIYYYTNKPTNE